MCNCALITNCYVFYYFQLCKQSLLVNVCYISQWVLELNILRWEHALDNDIGYQDNVDEDEFLPVSDDFLAEDQLKLAEEQRYLQSRAPGEASAIRKARRLESLGACTCKHEGAGVHKDVCPKSYISKAIALAQLKREETKHLQLVHAAQLAANKVADSRRKQRESAWELRQVSSLTKVN